MSEVELKEHFNQQLKDFKALEESRFQSLEKAVRLAARQMEKRLDSMNEFREQLKDQSNTFLPRDSFEAKHELIQKQVDELRMIQAEVRGKASQMSVSVAYIGIGISFLVAIIDFIFTFAS